MRKKILYSALICLSAMLTAACDKPPELIQVTTASAKAGADLSSLTWHGTVEALRIVTVSPNASGKVESIQVAEGQNVFQGDILFTLDSAEQQLQLKQAQAAYHTAQVAAANAATAYNENTLVQPAQIARDDAEANYLRLKTLFDAAAISEAELHNAATRLETAEAQLKAAQINQKSAYENAQAQTGGAQVAVEIAAKKLADCTVTAPIDGLAAKINVEPGDFVSPQSQALTLIDNSGLQVKIQVMETDIEQIKPDLAMEIQIQSLGETFAGTVTKVETLGNAKTGMYEVCVLFQETTPPPRVGLSADVRVQGAQVSLGVYVPEASVITQGAQTWVFVAENGSVHKRKVSVINNKDAYLEVEGLTAGDQVVMSSSAALEDGAPVQVITWTMDMR
jgi:multidrug resistance efflux pump